MMMLRAKQCLSVIMLLFTPTLAQFGVAGNRKKAGTTFQDLQEKAQKQQSGGAGAGSGMGGMEEYAQMMQKMMEDPEMKKMYEALGDMTNEAIDKMSKMSPDDMAKELEATIAAMTDQSIVDSVLEKKDEVLKVLMESNAIPAEELKKLQADPNLLEQYMRESFGALKDVLSNPEYLTAAMEGLSMMQGAMNTGDISKLLGVDMNDQENLEEFRLHLLQNPSMIPAEMQGVINDQEKWNAYIKENMDLMKGAAGGGKDGGKDEL